MDVGLFRHALIMVYPITESVLRWVETILAERFGHMWKLAHVGEYIKLELLGAEGAIFFDTFCQGFTTARSDLMNTNWDAHREGWQSVLGRQVPAPGFVSLPSPLIEIKAGSVYIHYDIIGLMYWMLARVEEIGRLDLDNHGRFSAISSHAYQNNYLDRPVVDEWLHLLGQVIHRQWPSCLLKTHKFGVKVSHDVDQPSICAFASWHTIIRMMAGHLLKRRDMGAFVRAPYLKLATCGELLKEDPYNTFDWIMDISEQNDLRSAFYFLCGRTDPIHDAEYELEHPAIRKLIRRIHERGHEIGLHPSYGTYQNPHALMREAARLKQICGEEGIEQAQWGGRMHYLRWSQQKTLRAWEQAGLDYDSTLGYADRPGFRCGTCFEYPAFDPVAKEALRLRIRPLVMMESSVIDAAYLGLGTGREANATAMALKDACRKVGGTFTLLWHNSTLYLPEHHKMYRNILTASRIHD
jgi:hypothetical protein